jgi:hypothetical protein
MLLLWLPKGYGHAIPRPDELQVRVLTPRSVVSALAAGYPVKVHPSAMTAPLWLNEK